MISHPFSSKHSAFLYANHSLSLSYLSGLTTMGVPDLFRTSLVTPVHKEGARDSASNHHPESQVTIHNASSRASSSGKFSLPTSTILCDATTFSTHSSAASSHESPRAPNICVLFGTTRNSSVLEYTTAQSILTCSRLPIKLRIDYSLTSYLESDFIPRRSLGAVVV